MIKIEGMTIHRMLEGMNAGRQNRLKEDKVEVKREKIMPSLTGGGKEESAVSGNDLGAGIDQTYAEKAAEAIALENKAASAPEISDMDMAIEVMDTLKDKLIGEIGSGTLEDLSRMDMESVVQLLS